MESNDFGPERGTWIRHYMNLELLGKKMACLESNVAAQTVGRDERGQVGGMKFAQDAVRRITFLALLSLSLLYDAAGAGARNVSANAPVLLSGLGMGFSRRKLTTDTSELVFDLETISCNFTTVYEKRSAWASPDEPCHQKLPFDMWVMMKGEGTENNADAQHLLAHCLDVRDVEVLELITPEDWNPAVIEDAPGEVLAETSHTATYLSHGALDFEAMCADDGITRVERVEAALGTSARSRMSRRLQATTSEAGAVHKVQELITGLENLGCSRTTGEDQVLCVMSDSFDRGGNVASLQESGDLPESVEVVKELPIGRSFLDEGSAMMELAFDIASGATYKFNTAFVGEQAFADDIITLATDEACDVIVDDITYFISPAFRDGVIAQAVDEAVAEGSLYFTSAGNNGFGELFTSNFECTTLIPAASGEPCAEGAAAHVFDDSRTDVFRYLWEISVSSSTQFTLQWDDGDNSARGINLYLFSLNSDGGLGTVALASNAFGRASTIITVQPSLGEVRLMAIVLQDSPIEDLLMRFVTWNSASFFSDSTGGSMYGQPCASSAISVAAMDWWRATGDDDAFADPETASVTFYSSRGPCLVDSGDGLETRDHPVTTAATSLATSTAGFFDFDGTSASAPVAAAIATIVRAACSDDKVVSFSDMMEMLTNYDYTIDVTSDADGAEETFGVEAGFGLISAEKMLAWVASNCPLSCPAGEATGPTPAPAETNIIYRGCVIDSKTRRVLEEVTTEEPMSAEICYEICNDGTYTHFGTQYGKECWCGFSPADVTVVDDSECDFECSGNDDEQCGGFQRMSLYSFSDDTCDTFTEEGCFADSSDSRLLTQVFKMDTMSAEICFNICNNGVFTHFGTQYGNECWCGTDPQLSDASELSSSQCDFTCAGTPEEICGGFFALTVYSIDCSQSTSDEYGEVGCFVDSKANRILPIGQQQTPMSAEVCSSLCNDGFSSHFGTEFGSECWCGLNPDLTANGDEVSSSECDMDCAGTTTGEKCGGRNRISVYRFESFTDIELDLVGCYADVKNDRAMGAAGSFTSSSMSNEVCVARCAGLGYAYAGTQYGRECWCDDSFDTHGTSTDCTFTCAGDSSSICGGFFALSVHAVA